MEIENVLSEELIANMNKAQLYFDDLCASENIDISEKQKRTLVVFSMLLVNRVKLCGAILGIEILDDDFLDAYHKVFQSETFKGRYDGDFSKGDKKILKRLKNAMDKLNASFDDKCDCRLIFADVVINILTSDK